MNYANHYAYRDINPFEIIRRVSDKTLEIRAMNAERDPSWKPDFVPWGSFGTVVNQHDQRWIITSDLNGEVICIRLTKSGWKDSDGGRYALSDEPFKFCEFNFFNF